MNYEHCQISNDEIYIGEYRAIIGLSVVSYSGSVQKSIKLPSPISDSLQTTIQDCNVAWSFTGHTNLVIMGREIMDGCHISVPGTNQADATLFVDFEIEKSCTSGYTVELNEDRLIIGGEGGAEVHFGSPFKNIDFSMSPCDDILKIAKTRDSADSISIESGSGNGKLRVDLDVQGSWSQNCIL